MRAGKLRSSLKMTRVAGALTRLASRATLSRQRGRGFQRLGHQRKKASSRMIGIGTPISQSNIPRPM
jgi:hypothetical protein